MKNGNHDLTLAREEQAKNMLIGHGVLKVRQQCPLCAYDGVRQIRRGKFRCCACGKEWGLRRDSILDGTRISYLSFINIVRLFSDNVPANDAANRLKLAYNTVQKIYALLGKALIGDSTGIHGSKKKPPINAEKAIGVLPTADPTKLSSGVRRSIVFGIRSHAGTITIENVETPGHDVINALTVPSMQRGNILFIDAHNNGYLGFIMYETDRHGEEVVRIRPPDEHSWSPLSEFWTFAGAAWKRHRGVGRDRIPEFVQELAFRFNNRNEDLFEIVLEKIAQADYRR